MSKKFNLFGFVLVLALVFIIAGCGKEQKNPVGPIGLTIASIQCDEKPPVTSLKVTKTAEGHWNRYLDWNITKTADPTYAEICVNDEQVINYTVTVTQVGYTDKYLVKGEITIQNDPAEPDRDKTACIKYVDDEIEARVDGSWVSVKRVNLKGEFTIEPGGTCIVEYEIEFVPPEGYKALRNVAYVYLINHAPGPDTPKEFFYRADFTIPSVPTLVNECVDVTDSWKGSLGQVCGEGASETFTYSRTVSYPAAGTYYVENTAYANGKSASAKVKIDVVICDMGCTLTQGYWKTHSKYGPAPYDDTWALIGEDTRFFQSGKSYYQVLWTPPAGGNVYYILAHQYIAAKLNMLNGASSTPEVDAAMVWSTNFFNTYKPTDKLSKTVSQQAKSYADLLDKYNNGLIGPGHCDE